MPAICHKVETRQTRLSIYMVGSAVILALLVSAIYFRFANLSIPDIGLGSPAGDLTLISAWAKGGVIALVRHEERCDRSTAPCLDAMDGITRRGKDVAVATGEIFERFGVESSDILASPTTRTKQTATYMFKPAVAEQEWLANCKNITLGDISKYKVEGRNLILVTHSSCIKRIEETMNISNGIKPAYGSLIFIFINEEGKTPVAAEYIEAEQFITKFSRAK